MNHWTPNLRALKLFQVSGHAGQIRVPQNRSAPGGKNQGLAARTRDPKGESGLRRTDQSPQNAKGPDILGLHVTDPSMWDGSGPCRSNQGRGTDQGPVGQIRGTQDETGHRRNRTNRDPRDRLGPPGTDQSPTRRTRAPEDKSGLTRRTGALRDGSGPLRTNQGSIGLIRALLTIRTPRDQSRLRKLNQDPAGWIRELRDELGPRKTKSGLRDRPEPRGKS